MKTEVPVETLFTLYVLACQEGGSSKLVAELARYTRKWKPSSWPATHMARLSGEDVYRLVRATS